MMDSDDDLMKLAATAARELQGDKNQKEPEPVNTDPNRLKCDPLVGKTSLVYVFVNDASIDKNSRHLLLPGVLDVQEKRVEFEKKTYTLIIHDTDYDKMNRISNYIGADLIIVCYSVADVNSLRNVDKKWIPELKQFAPDKPLVLIGCKADVRSMIKTNPCMELVDDFDGMHMSATIDSQAFHECSAKTMENVINLFSELPGAVERHRVLKAYNQRLNTLPHVTNDAVPATYNATHKPVPLFQTLVPMAKQIYHNIVACTSNPGAFVESKKAIVAHVPLLKSWLPYEDDDTVTAKEELPLPNPISLPIQQQRLKRLFEDSTPDDKTEEEKEESQSKRRKDEQDKKG